MGFWPETPDTCLGGTCSAPGGRMPISMPPAAKFASTMGLLRTSLNRVLLGHSAFGRMLPKALYLLMEQAGACFLPMNFIKWCWRGRTSAKENDSRDKHPSGGS